MIKPFLKDEEFLADVIAARREKDQFHLWWLGQSGFLLQWQGRHLLFDPYLSDSLTKKYALTEKPHVRMTERVVAPEQLDFIDIVTSSHSHTDHLDAETLIPLLKINPSAKLIIPEANRAFVAARLQISPEAPIGLDAGQSWTDGEFLIHAVPAAHDAVERDEMGRCKYLGYVVQFGSWTIYHSGDTRLYPEMVNTLRKWRIDVALLPINGAAPERKVAGNLNAFEAAQLAREIGAGLAIPCHYEMFEFNTADPNTFVEAAREIKQPHHVQRSGERWSSLKREPANR